MPKKISITYTIDPKSLETYYQYEPEFSSVNSENVKELNINIERYVEGEDWNIPYFIQLYFQPIEFRDFRDEEILVITRLFEEITAITYLFAKYEWNTYYRHLYESYDAYSETSKSRNISNEVEQLKEIINILLMKEHLDRSDATFRLKAENKDVIKENTLKIGLEERDLVLTLLLERRIEEWFSKHLSEEDVKFFIRSLNKKHTYSKNLPIVQVIKKMNSTTSQAIMKIFQDEELYPKIELNYLNKLHSEIMENWRWDERASPLNKFNSLIAKTLDRYLSDKSNELNAVFRIGMRKQKEHIIFSCLRFFGFVPQNPKLNFDQPSDLKEDYIKDLLKK
ncbi:hypothetical protein BWD42_13735 [Sphingobacterium sp. CZ-UAM]|uniref:hypothetical protein n=1 Tax=Sphingobacterium sp. CZ-UAM TaxID=1933868 RepID=UPI0009872F55|nr:hypothetical protein [Sphingobacterium sp. CZ-UAM]OOG18313.1 hypothetical protein BWD42_13735 [Sphingobacterium sp. CZ-UAM]